MVTIILCLVILIRLLLIVLLLVLLILHKETSLFLLDHSLCIRKADKTFFARLRFASYSMLLKPSVHTKNKLKWIGSWLTIDWVLADTY